MPLAELSGGDTMPKCQQTLMLWADGKRPLKKENPKKGHPLWAFFASCPTKCLLWSIQRQGIAAEWWPKVA